MRPLSRRRWMRLALLLAIVAVWSAPSGYAAMRNFDLGDPISTVELTALGGKSQLFSFERPSVVVFWASWSPLSQSALAELVAKAPKGGIRWQVVPINIDKPDVTAADTARLYTAARAAGWYGPLWYDREYRLVERWGIFSAPTVIITNLGGAIAELEHDWTRAIQTRLFTLYFGAITDSFPGLPDPPASEHCLAQAAMARRLWRLGQESGALARMRVVVDSCAGLPRDLARYAEWAWRAGDSLRLAMSLDSVLERGGETAWPLTLRAELAVRRHDTLSALDLTRRAIAADSLFAPAWIRLLTTSLAAGDTTTALAAYERLKTLCPQEPRVLAAGSILAERQGQITRAATRMRRAVEARLRPQRQ